MSFAVAELADLYRASNLGGLRADIEILARRRFDSRFADLSRFVGEPRLRQLLRAELKKAVAPTESSDTRIEEQRDREREKILPGADFRLTLLPKENPNDPYAEVGPAKHFFKILHKNGVAIWDRTNQGWAAVKGPVDHSKMYFFDPSSKFQGVITGMDTTKSWHARKASANGRYLVAFDKYGRPRRVDLQRQVQESGWLTRFGIFDRARFKSVHFVGTHVRDDGSVVGFKEDGTWLEWDSNLKLIGTSSFEELLGRSFSPVHIVDMSPDESQALVSHRGGTSLVDFKTKFVTASSVPNEYKTVWYKDYAVVFATTTGRVSFVPRRDRLPELVFKSDEYGPLDPSQKFSASIAPRNSHEDPFVVKILDLESGQARSVEIPTFNLDPDLQRDFYPKLVSISRDGRRAAIVVFPFDESRSKTTGSPELFIVDVEMPLLVNRVSLPRSYSSTFIQPGFNESGDVLHLILDDGQAYYQPVRIDPL